MNYNDLSPVEKRNLILSILNANPEGTTYAELTARLGDPGKQVSVVLSVMKNREEVECTEKSQGQPAKWFALTDKTRDVAADNPRRAKKSAPFESIENGVRVVRLLDKIGHSSGGQCAGRSYGAIQCGFQERSLKTC